MKALFAGLGLALAIGLGMAVPGSAQQYTAHGEEVPTGPSLGIGFWPHDQGIEVNDVVRGSAAQRAGVEVGMIITKINDTTLAGLTIIETENLVKGLEGLITLTLDNGRTISLAKAPIAQPGG